MKTLYLRIVYITLIVMVLSSLLGFLGANLYYQVKLKPVNDEKIMKVAKEIKQYYLTNDEVKIENYLEHIGELGYEVLKVNQAGDKKYFGEAFRKTAIDQKVIDDVLAGEPYHGILNFNTGWFITGFFDNDVRNTVGVEVEGYALFIRPSQEDQFGELRIFIAMIALFTGIISVIAVFIMTRFIVKPVRMLTKATKAFSKGETTITLPTKRQDEIGQLARSFEEMTTELSLAEQKRQEFVANVSHELQTPLTAIQGFARILQNQELSKAEREKYLRIITNETNRLSGLTNQLLLLSYLDQTDELLTPEEVRVSEQIQQFTASTEWRWRAKNIFIQMETVPALVLANGPLLYQVWQNIIGNAINYTPIDGEINIKMSHDNDFLFVSISNTGDKIPADDLAHIFERFYQADKMRERTEESSGLGLAISAEIVKRHRGTIQVESNDEETIFTVMLPKHK